MLKVILITSAIFAVIKTIARYYQTKISGKRHRFRDYFVELLASMVLYVAYGVVILYLYRMSLHHVTGLEQGGAGMKFMPDIGENIFVGDMPKH